MPVSEDIVAKDIEFTLAGRSLRVGLRGQQQPLLDAVLWSEVDPEDTYFEVSRQAGQLCVVVYLAKRYVETWEQVFQQPYTWEQGGRYNEEVRVFIPIADHVKLGDIEFQLSHGRLVVGLQGRCPFIDGELWGAVDLADCGWMIEEHAGQRAVIVSLAKKHVRENWDRLLKTEEGKGGLPVFEPGSRKDVDLAVLGSLDYVNALLNQRDVPYAQQYLKHMLPEDDDEGPQGDEPDANSRSAPNLDVDSDQVVPGTD